MRVLTWAVRAPPRTSDSAFSRGGGGEYGTRWALQRSLAHSGVGVVRCGTSGYSQDTHGVLTQYRVSETGVPRRRGVDVSHSVAQSTAPRKALVCASSPVGVLYSAQGVLAGFVRTPPSAECKEAHSPASPAAAVLSDCAMHCDFSRAQRRRACRRARPRRPTPATPTRPRARRRPSRRRPSRRRAGRTLPTRRVRPLPRLYRESTAGYSVSPHSCACGARPARVLRRIHATAALGMDCTAPRRGL